MKSKIEKKKTINKPTRKLSREQVKKRISEFFTDLCWMFDYQNWDRCVIYMKAGKNGKDITSAEVVTDLAYRRITIYIYPTFFDSNLEEQRGYLLHEFCHMFSDRLFNRAIGLLNGELHTHRDITEDNEACTSKVKEILEALLIGKLKYAREGFAKYTK